MRLHRIGVATLAALLVVAPANAQTNVDLASRSSGTLADRSILVRLGLPAQAPTADDAGPVLAGLPAPTLDTGASAAAVAHARRQQTTEMVPWPWGWSLRGFLGGLLAGPIGVGIAFRMASNSEVPTLAFAGAAEGDDGFDAAAYVERVIDRRKEATFAGGLVGTGVFLYALLVVLDIDNSGETTIDGELPDPTDEGF